MLVGVVFFEVDYFCLGLCFCQGELFGYVVDGDYVFGVQYLGVVDGELVYWVVILYCYGIVGVDIVIGGGYVVGGVDV